MTTSLSSKPKGFNMLAQATAVAIFGAVIGSGATAFTYHSLLGGADKLDKIEQIETTVEHSRIVNDEVLAVLKKIEVKLDEVAKPVAPSIPALTSGRAHNQIDAAIEGLFDSIGEPVDAEKTANEDKQADPVKTEEASKADAMNGIEVVEKNASDEASAVQKAE